MNLERFLILLTTIFSSGAWLGVGLALGTGKSLAYIAVCAVAAYVCMCISFSGFYALTREIGELRVRASTLSYPPVSFTRPRRATPVKRSAVR